MLIHFDHIKQTILETNFSDFVTDNTLSQTNENDKLHSVVYYSCKILFAEFNYEVYNKKLLTIINCLEIWCSELKFISIFIQIFSDYCSLEYFMIKKTLTHCQTHWAEKLSEYNFKIIYWDDKINQKTDALIRQSDSQKLEDKH